MTSRLNPYILFRGEARAALDFYQSVFGGEATAMTHGQFSPEADPSYADLIMHGQLVTPAGYWIMLSDVPEGMPFEAGHTVTMCLNGDDEAELTGYWQRLSEGATIGMELAEQGWGDIYGDLTDKFGIRWSIDISPKR